MTIIALMLAALAALVGYQMYLLNRAERQKLMTDTPEEVEVEETEADEEDAPAEVEEEETPAEEEAE